MAGHRDLRVEVDLDETQLARLAAVLGVEGDELWDRLVDVAAAALDEYVLAFTGVRAPATLREVRELRLRLLYEHLPSDEPTDEQIAQLFQLTPSQVGTLIAGTRARFGPELDTRLRGAAIAALEGATRVNDDMVRVVVSDSLARYLRDLISRTSAPQFEKRKDASRTYDVGRTTVVALCRQLGIEPERVKELKKR